MRYLSTYCMNEHALEWWRQRIHTYFVALAPVRGNTLSFILWVMDGLIFHTFHGMHVGWIIQRESITRISAIDTVSDWSHVRWLYCLLSCSQWFLFNELLPSNTLYVDIPWEDCGPWSRGSRYSSLSHAIQTSHCRIHKSEKFVMRLVICFE